MTKSIKIISIVFLFLFSSIPLAFGAEPLLDPFYSQGQEVLNAPPIHGVSENVDLFSGNLSIAHTDVHFPGNGGLDLTLTRRYNSAIWGRRDVLPTLVASLNQSPLGLGWSMHMGIVRNPYGTGSDNVFAANNPVIEMPDGSQHPLYRVTGQLNTFISKDFWLFKSIDAAGHWQLTLADGTVYTFEYSEMSAQAGYEAYSIVGGPVTQIAQVTKIQNAANTASISITYNKSIVQGSSFINTITDSTGRVITFHYSSGQLASISLDNKTLISYQYQAVSGPQGSFSILSEALPPVGSSWKYAYNNIYELQTLTYPSGGTITYQYTDTPFYIAPYGSHPQPQVSFSVVTQRTIQNTSTNGITTEPAGTSTYTYVTGGSSTAFNVTTVNGPDGAKEVHKFMGWGMAKDGFVFAIGWPVSKELSRNGETYYFESNDWAWVGPISNDQISNASWNNGFATATDTTIAVPVPFDKYIVTDEGGTIEWSNNGVPILHSGPAGEYYSWGYLYTGQMQTTLYNSYDAYGNPTSITEYSNNISQNPMPERHTTKTYFYNTGANIVSNKPQSITVTGDSSGTFPGTFVINNTYDTYGNLTQMTKYGVTTNLGYTDGKGNVTSITDANGHITTFVWDKGRISQKQNFLYTISRVVNEDGTIASETDGNGNATSYAYDANLRLTSKSPPGVNPTTITYDPFNTFKTSARDQYWSTTYYDGFGRSAKTLDSIGVINDTVYTAYGPKNYTASNTGDKIFYDFMGRVDKIEHKDNSSIDYTYWGSYTWIDDEQSSMTELIYQTFGSPNEKWLTSVTDALSTSSTYSYNAIGSLTQTSQPGNLTRTFNYDVNNFLFKEQSPDRGLIQYTRDYVGNIKTKDDAMGTTSYTYDELNRLTQTCTTETCTSSGIVISYTYDNADNRLTTNYSAPNLAAINYTYLYDQTNKLKQKTEQMGTSVFTTKYTYDMDDNLTDIYYPSTSNRHIQYSYNANNQVTSVPGFVNSISYYLDGTPLGLPYQYTYANGDTTTLTYNIRNLTTGIMAGASAVNVAYAYDWRGNTGTITNHLNPAQNQSFSYDHLNRLTVFNGAWGSGVFTYDVLGNRLSKSTGSNSISYGYDLNNRLASATSGVNENSFTYNIDGDLTGIENMILAYDQLHNLVSYSIGTTPLGQYAYDGNSMRVTKTTSNGNTTVYHYDQGGRVLSESDGNGNFIVDYVYLHGKLVAKVVNTLDLPLAPTNLSASVTSSSGVNLSWTNNATNADGYEVERKAGADGTYSQVASVSSSSAGYADTGLSQNATYVYRVRAFNQSGYSSYSNEATATTPPAAVPTAPTGLLAAAISCNQVTLTWTNNATNADGILIEREIASGGTYTQIASLPTNTATSFADTSVSPSTTYSYRVRGYNILGASLYSNEASVTTPTAQGGTIFTMAGNGQQGYTGDGGLANLASLNAPKGVTADSAGNVYIADGPILRKVDADGIITTVPANATFRTESVAFDTAGNMYIADSLHDVIWKMDTSGAIAVIAGMLNPAGGYIGDGYPATQSILGMPTAVAVDNAGNVYITDPEHHRIRMVGTNGILYTIAGTGSAWFGGDGGSATSAGLNYPTDVKVDIAGNIYIADAGNARIRKITSGGINTIAGNGQFGSSGDGGLATLASINANHVAVDSAGNVYISDSVTNRIRIVNTTGIITTIAGNGQAGFSGDGGPATLASLNSPRGVAVDNAGNMYIADFNNYRIRKVTPPDLAIITTSQFGPVGAAYNQALAAIGGQFPYTWSITAGALPDGLSLNNVTGTISGTPTTVGTYNLTVQVAGANNQTSAKAISITIYAPLTISTLSLPPGIIGTPYNQTLAATGGVQPYVWSITGGALPDGLTLDGATGTITGMPTTTGSFSFTAQVRDANNTTRTAWLTINIFLDKLITAYSFVGTVATTVIDEMARTISVFVPYGTNVTALVATFTNTGASVTVGSVVQVSGTTLNDFTNAVEYTIHGADGSTGAYTVTVTKAATIDNSTITTIAGNGEFGFSGDGGPAIQASFSYPWETVVDSIGNVYIVDSENSRIRKVDTSGVITTIAGSGMVPDFTGDGGPATQATLAYPSSIALDTAGNIYIADSGNYRIRKVDTAGIITTVAGNGEDYSGDNGQATEAGLSAWGVAVDASGNIFIADGDSNRIRKVNTSGIITTVAGNGTAGYSGDGGLATSARLSDPGSVAVDAAGNIYIGDESNNRIRKVNTSRNISTVAGNGQIDFSGDGGPATQAGLSIYGMSVDSSGNIYIADGDNYRVRKVNTSGTISTIAGNGLAGFAGDGGPATLASINPSGAMLDAAGTLYIADAYNYRIRKVTFPSPTITTTSLASGMTGTAYSQTLAATGGQTPYTWSRTSGSLPTGLSLTASTGVISGTPTATGTFAFTIQVKDANNAMGIKSLSITITPPPLSISTASLSNGTVGSAYSQTLAAAGGTAPYTWLVTAGSGTLPAGLTLNSSTGVISGTPTTTGMSTFTVQVTDANTGTATKAFSITITTTPAVVAQLSGWTNIYSAAPNNTSATNLAAGSFTVGSGSQRLLLVSVVMEIGTAANPTISATYGGAALTQIRITANTQREIVWMGYLTDTQIGSGSKALAISYSGATGNVSALHVKWASYTGVNQTTPVASSGAVNTATTSATFGSTISYVTNGMTTVVAGNGGTPATGTLTATPAFTAGTATTTNAQTSRTFTTAKHTATGSYASSTTVSWSGTTSTRSGLVVVSLQP